MTNSHCYYVPICINSSPALQRCLKSFGYNIFQSQIYQKNSITFRFHELMTIENMLNPPNHSNFCLEKV